MSRRSEGLFAGRGISWHTIAITLLVVVLAFALGIATGWATGLLPGIYREAKSPSPSPSPTPSPTATVEVSIPPLAPIDRELTDDDLAAGVTTVHYTRKGEGTFTAVPGEDTLPGENVPVRLVRIDVEDGLTVDSTAFGEYVMTILNDPRGWGSEGRLRFVQTQGVPDVRIVLASPYTAEAMCPVPHARGKGVAAVVESTTAPDAPAAGASQTPELVTCADRGTVAVSQYDWIAGLPGYEDNIVDARAFLINHGIGHVLGEAEQVCESDEALVMVDQRESMEECTVNPWPFPDAKKASATPTPDPEPSP